MADEPSVLLKVRLQGPDKEVWGVDLNIVIAMLEEAIAGTKPIALVGNRTLTSTNYVSNEVRQAVLVFTDDGLTENPTITVPALSNWWWVANTTGFDILFSSGGVTATSRAGTAAMIRCDGTDCFSGEQSLDQLKAPTEDFSMGGQRIKNLAAPVENTDAINKEYVVGLAFNEVDLPAQEGEAGKVVTTNGTTSNWDTIAAILGYASDAVIYDQAAVDQLLLTQKRRLSALIT